MLTSLIILFATALIPILAYSIRKAGRKWDFFSFVLMNRTRFLLGGILLILVGVVFALAPELREAAAGQLPEAVAKTFPSLKGAVVDAIAGWIIGTFCVTSLGGKSK